MTLIFKENSNPLNVCNRVLKRLVVEGKILAVPRTKDLCYLYTSNPSHIHHKSNKIDHHLKIVDFYIALGCPKDFIIEPLLGDYEPDIFMKDRNGKSICVEIQLTKISSKKMQEKIDLYVKEYGKEHDSKTFVIVSNYRFKVRVPNGFQLKFYKVPAESTL
ncbi:hypothetical protein Bfsp1_28 [Cytobacillus phage Bfsp1]|nr:hypothetical protein Bfsp1_28 [Cytobacillus phage Bfsp1]